MKGMTMRAIAADANITATAIYRHFRNKQHLVDEVVKSGYDELDGLMLKKTPSLKSMANEVASYALQHRNLFEVMLRPGDKGVQVHERIAYHLDQYMRPHARDKGVFLWAQMRGVLAHGHGLGEKQLRGWFGQSMEQVLPLVA